MGSIDGIYHREILDLLSMLFDQSIILDIKRLSGERNNKQSVPNLQQMVNDIDKKIGGDSIADLIWVYEEQRGPDGTTFKNDTAAYHDEKDREIFRPLQYAILSCIAPHRMLNARFSIQESCAHVEIVLKKKLKAKNIDADESPLGAALHKAKNQKLLDATNIELIEKINHVYRKAKHDFSFKGIPSETNPNFDSSMFNLLEAVSMFFICRKVGLLLDPGLA